MNDQTTIDDASPPAIAKANLSAGGEVAGLVPQSLDDAFRLSKALAASGDMVPKHFQGHPEVVMAAVLRGMEIGLAPMQALSNIAVINGRASLWGDALPALMQRAGHSIDVELTGEGENMTATATLIRGDTGREIVRSFSVADAKKANLWGKAGPWQSYPKRMLSMRARAWACRDGAADALMGLQVAEEAQDMAPMRDVTPKPEGPNLAQRLTTAPQEPQEGDVPDAQPSDTPEDVSGVTEALRASAGAGVPGSQAWEKGIDFYTEGKPLEDCPYDDDADRADFAGGWTFAEKEGGE